ncbi:MAG: hypothetical protein AAFZ80_03090, partial [Cyanobacteria bacterium P01_A01_bin.105]
EAAPVTGEANTPATETPSSKTEIDTSKAETAPSHPKEASAEAADTAQTAQPQGEPGYVGYPLMGETAAGEPIYYLSSQPVDCADAGCVSITFLQVDATDAYRTLEGQAVANCKLETLSEVIIEGDLVAVQVPSPEPAMAELLQTACQAHRPGEILTAQTATSQSANTVQSDQTETAIAPPDLTRYTRICEGGPCNEAYHSLPRVKYQSGEERLLTTERVILTHSGEPIASPEPLDIMCSTERPMVIKDDGSGGYILFHLAPHVITSDEDINVTTLYWSVCHNTRVDTYTASELLQTAINQNYSEARTFSVYYADFFEPFEG